MFNNNKKFYFCTIFCLFKKGIDWLKNRFPFLIIQDLYDLGFAMDHLKGNQK